MRGPWLRKTAFCEAFVIWICRRNLLVPKRKVPYLGFGDAVFIGYGVPVIGENGEQLKGQKGLAEAKKRFPEELSEARARDMLGEWLDDREQYVLSRIDTNRVTQPYQLDAMISFIASLTLRQADSIRLLWKLHNNYKTRNSYPAPLPPSFFGEVKFRQFVPKFASDYFLYWSWDWGPERGLKGSRISQMLYSRRARERELYLGIFDIRRMLK